MNALDARLNAFRPDLADERLAGRVEAARFAGGEPARVAAAVADLRGAPAADAGLNSQLLHGETVRVFDRAGGFAWVQAVRDGYVGYVAEAELGAPAAEPTHLVTAPRSFLYPGPDLRLPRAGVLSLGSLVAATGEAETRGTKYLRLADGRFMIAAHLAPAAHTAPDYVSVAETLVNTPYLWGGASAFGIDCSGLVQLSMRMAGAGVLRDSDMQQASIGGPLQPGPDFSGLRRGDLVFWKGHVAIMTGPDRMVHANGHTMLVSHEGLREAVDRIGYLYGGPTAFRRPAF